MATFEFNNPSHIQNNKTNEEKCPDPRRVREECIIALKVYDSCRQQDCLTYRELGPARAVDNCCICDRHFTEGDIIDPPNIILHSNLHLKREHKMFSLK